MIHFCPEYNFLEGVTRFWAALAFKWECWCENAIYIYISREIFQLNCSLIFYFPLFWAWKNANEMHSSVPEGMDVTFFISRLQENKGAIGRRWDFLRFSFTFCRLCRSILVGGSFNIENTIDGINHNIHKVSGKDNGGITKKFKI